MTTRRAFPGTLAGSLLAAPLTAKAQQAGKIYRIGHLSMNTATTPEIARIWAVFLLALKELGWVEGRNLAIERLYAEGRVDRLPGLAAELVALKVDVIMAASSPPLGTEAHLTTAPGTDPPHRSLRADILGRVDGLADARARVDAVPAGRSGYIANPG